MRKFAWVLGLAAAVLSPAWAVYGMTSGVGSSDSTFVWVGRAGGASGVVIDPHWVLTARHVGGNFIILNGTQYVGDAVYDHPTADLHLIHFAAPFGGFYPIYTGNPIGHIATIVGFGDSGSIRTDGKGFVDLGGFGTRRVATNNIGMQQVIDYQPDPNNPAYTWHTPCLLADLDAPAGNNLPPPWNRDWFGDGFGTPNEGGLMAGDSGGGWFINVGGTWQVVGISNYIGWDDTVFPNEAHLYEFGVSLNCCADLTNANLRAWINGKLLRTSPPRPSPIPTNGGGGGH